MPRLTTEPTPNPDSLKFSSTDGTFLAQGLAAFRTAAEAEEDPLGQRLFAITGVANVLIVPQFVTITKHPAADWNAMLPQIEQVLEAHLEEG